MCGKKTVIIFIKNKTKKTTFLIRKYNLKKFHTPRQRFIHDYIETGKKCMKKNRSFFKKKTKENFLIRKYNLIKGFTDKERSGDNRLF